MTRHTLSNDHVHSNIQDRVNNHHKTTVDEVRHAVERDAIVVVGMAQNPHCKRARRLLKNAQKTFTYLEYGSYLGQWRKRTAIKMWSGWPTFPMVFVQGQLVGGADELDSLLKSGELDTITRPSATA